MPKIKRKTLGSYPYVSVLFSVTMALFVIGLFGVLFIFAQKISEIIKENIEIHVYLDYDLPQNKQEALLKSIYKQPFINIKNDKKQIFYISKEQAAQKFIKETGEDFISFIGDNPLRDAYVFKVDAEYSEKHKLRQIKSQIEAIDGVYEAIYIESVVDAINQNTAKISLILLSFAVILITVVFILINSSIRLAMYSQRFLIRSMQLVGATSFFIQKPFLIRAFFHGILGGFFASVLLISVLQYAYYQIPELTILENLEQIAILMLGLVVFGGLLGIISSLRSITKYLKMSLNELF
jgi:cell division transport system permease protein